jgi:hypothetical protein
MNQICRFSVRTMKDGYWHLCRYLYVNFDNSGRGRKI